MITRNLMTMMVLGAALMLGACDSDKAPAAKDDKQPAAKANDPGAEDRASVAAPSLDPKVERAVTLANMISAKPENADAILEDAGLDREAFERMLYEIARDPELSKSYAVAREA